mgnify:CR=1 FL=1
MSAINAIIQRDAVHLLTDAASYDSAGNLVAAIPKVALLPRINAAMACRGPRASVPLFCDLLNAAASSYDELKAKAPTFLRDLRPMLAVTFAYCELGDDFDVVVAGISESVGPDAYLVCSHQRYGVEPWTVVQFGGLAMMPADAAMKARVFASIPDNVDLVDPERDGRIILEAQRAFPMDHGGDRNFVGVGGFAQLTSITREGISTRVIHRWSDEVGQPIGASDILTAAAMLRAAA